MGGQHKKSTKLQVMSPSYKYRVGNTYGTTTNKLLVYPADQKTEDIVISDRLADDFQVKKTPRNELDINPPRFLVDDKIFLHPTEPLNEAFIAKEYNKHGQRFSMLASKQLSPAEQIRKADLQSTNYYTKLSPIQEISYSKDDFIDIRPKSPYHFQLTTVRPEKAGPIRDVPTSEPPLSPPREHPSPYFMDNPDIQRGLTRQEPFGYGSFGKPVEPMTNSKICDFVGNYRKRLSTEWTPITVSKADPPLNLKSNEIYHKHIGLLPNYMGHVPGAMFRCGRSYGDDTVDVKRWFRGDFN